MVLNRKIASYAAATTVVGIAGVQSSQAAIVYTADTSGVHSNADYTINVAGTSASALQFSVSTKNAQLYLQKPAGSTLFVAQGPVVAGQTGTGTRADPVKYSAGDLIGPTTASFIGPVSNGDRLKNNAGDQGNFAGDGSTEYLGVQINNPTTGALNYGWVGVKFTTNSGGADYTVTGYAYDDSGAAIAAGNTVSVPEPASLSALALGAAAVLRRKRDVA